MLKLEIARPYVYSSESFVMSEVSGRVKIKPPRVDLFSNRCRIKMFEEKIFSIFNSGRSKDSIFLFHTYCQICRYLVECIMTIVEGNGRV